MLQLTHLYIKQKPDSDCWEIDPEIKFVTFSPVREQHKNTLLYIMCICALNKNILAWTKKWPRRWKSLLQLGILY